MAAFIGKLNSADQIASLWRTGQVAALVAQERISALGFYAIDVGECAIVAWLDGVRFELGGTQ